MIGDRDEFKLILIALAPSDFLNGFLVGEPDGNVIVLSKREQKLEGKKVNKHLVPEMTSFDLSTLIEPILLLMKSMSTVLSELLRAEARFGKEGMMGVSIGVTVDAAEGGVRRSVVEIGATDFEFKSLDTLEGGRFRFGFGRPLEGSNSSFGLGRLRFGFRLTEEPKNLIS